MTYVYLLISVSSVALVVGRIYQHWRDTQPDPALEIKPPVYRWLKADEDLALRTQRRRDAADAIRARASSVESGASVGVLLRRAK